MKCEEFRTMLDALLDDELSEQQRAELQEHADRCVDCKEELFLTERLKALTGNMKSEIVPPLPAQAAWRNAIRKEEKNKRFRKLYRIAGAVAAAAILLVGAVAGIRAIPQKKAAEPEFAFSFIATDGESDRAIPADVMEETASTKCFEQELHESSAWELSVTVDEGEKQTVRDRVMSVIQDFGGQVEAELSTGITAYIPVEQQNAFYEVLSMIGTVETVSDNLPSSGMALVVINLQ